MAVLDKIGLERLWSHFNIRLKNKVDKVDGKGLSTEDYTTEDKDKLSNLSSVITEERVSKWDAK